MSTSIGIIGNGFDIAHGLSTKYSDFLEILKDPEMFGVALDAALDGNYFDTDKYGKYFSHLSKLDMDQVNKMVDILKTNVWAYYYGHCEAEMEGWIDFESEIVPVLIYFDHIFNSEVKIDNPNHRAKILNWSSLPQTYQRISTFFNQYIGKNGFIGQSYISKAHGLLIEKILTEFKRQFDYFLEAMKIYFCEFVDKIEIVKIHNAFLNRQYDQLISFNYTCTEEKYNSLCEVDTIHIHGSIKSDPCNFVLGTEDLEWDKDYKFIYFTKSFQKIQKHLFFQFDIDKIDPDTYVYVYGHSLGKHDHEFFKKLFLKVREVTIFYYSETDYEQKVANLIQMLGRDIFEKQLVTQQIMLLNL